MLRTILSAALAATVAIPFGASAEDEPLPLAFDDATFLKTIASNGIYDVFLCDFVGSQTRNDELRKLAAAIVVEYIVAGDSLKATAEDLGIKLPEKLDAAHQKQYEAFKLAAGKELESQFVKTLRQHLTTGVTALTLASRRAENPAVRAFAGKMRPRIEKHLEALKNLEK